MANRSLSTREVVMLLFLVVLLVGVSYYMFYYQPLQNELSDLANQSAALDGDIQVAAAKAASMDKMQAELDEILSRPEDEITEIAPYDNAKVVMSQLNGILSASLEYDLKFADAKIEGDGTVRRSVSMAFKCEDYNHAKSIVKSLSSSHWRCLITNVAVETTDKRVGKVQVNTEDDEEELVYNGIMTSPVTVSATIVFFESTNLG